MPVADGETFVLRVPLVRQLAVQPFQQRCLAVLLERRTLRTVAPPRGIRIGDHQVAEPMRLVEQLAELLRRAELGMRRQVIGILLVEAAVQVVGEMDLAGHRQLGQVRQLVLADPA